jgi:hydroxylamine dehydrogenase
MNPNGFTYISWSNLLKKYVDIQSEAKYLKKIGCIGEEGQVKAVKGAKEE